MSQTIAVINQKGGVGKSTTAQALACGLNIKGYKTLCIDLDSQGNLTYSAGIDATEKPTASDILTGAATVTEATHKTAQGDYIAADNALIGLIPQPTDRPAEALKRALKGIRGRYDYIIIDTPPALGIITANALTAADTCIIPAQADIYSLQGIGQLYSSIQQIRADTNPALQIAGILLTRYKGRAVLSRNIRELLEDTAAQMQTRVFRSTIRDAIAISEAQTLQRDIFSYAPRSNAAEDYRAFVNEFLKGEHNRCQRRI